MRDSRDKSTAATLDDAQATSSVTILVAPLDGRRQRSSSIQIPNQR
jgi:hypothetical protein